MKRLPLIPTLLVAAAVAVMIGLGIWQVHRAQWKEELLRRYEANSRLPSVAFPKVPMPADQALLFRRASGFCLQAKSWTARSGRNRVGEAGWRHIAQCGSGAEGPGMAVDLGWSNNGDAPKGYRGGPVSGVIGPDRDHILLLVADAPAPGLQASAPPSLEEIPNNHRGYAIQWFLFAAIAVVIYALALRRRGQPGGDG
jgi:cytochrome oxidase assembly protein ShyY1